MLLGLALVFGFSLIAHAQEDDDARIIEEDYRVTSADDRQRTVAALLVRADELRKAGQIVEAVRTLNRVGRFQIRMYQAEEAVQTFQEALKLLESQPDIKTRVDSLNGLALSYDYRTKCDLSEPLASQAITLSQQNNYVAGEAEGLITLSDCQNHRDHVLALKSASEGLELWRSINRKRGMAGAHLVIASYQMAQSNLEESTQNLEAAQSLYRELNSIEQQVNILIYFGNIESRKGAWQNALAFYVQARSMTDEKAEPYTMGAITANIGGAFLESGLPDVALTKFLEAMAYYRQARNPRAVTAMNWSVGRSHYFSGNYQEALNSLETARSESEASKDIALTAFCDDFLGRTHAALNQPSLALNYYQAALAGYAAANKPLEVARTRALMGSIFQQQGTIEKAREHYQIALDAFRHLSDQVNESAALYALGRLALSQNNLDQAESYLRQSIDVTENMRRVSTSRDLTAAFSATVQDRYESYVECLMRKHRAEPARAFDVRAFEINELARARSLAELLRATQTNLIAGLDPKLAEQEKSLRQSLRVKEDYRVTMLGAAYKKEELDALETELTRLESEYKQVIETIRARYPRYEQITRPAGLTLSQIQAQVLADDQTVLLEYSLGTDRSYLWVVTRAQILSYELPGRNRIETEARRFYDLISAGQPKPGETFDQRQQRVRQTEAEMPAVAANLSTMLLGPAADTLGTKRLLIVADGALQYIPFQALTLPAKPGPADSSATAVAEKQRPLILDHEIINEPSASILALVLDESAKRRPARGSVAILADPVFEKDDARITSAGTNAPTPAAVSQPEEVAKAFRDIRQPAAGQRIPRLWASRDEARAIMDIVPWRTGFEAVDFAANRATVAGSDLNQYRIVHFATHAFLDDQHPEWSGIALSLVDQRGLPQEGLLRVNDIYNLNLPVNLVVLSACNTGLGKDVKGEGLIGLTRGFMYAGVGGVTASLWKVDDEATAELMKRFYEGMFKRGFTPAAALREAQISMWREQRWHSPYHWAAFVIQGKYDQNVSAGLTGTRNLFWIVVIGIFGAVSLTGFFLISRRRKKIL